MVPPTDCIICTDHNTDQISNEDPRCDQDPRGDNDKSNSERDVVAFTHYCVRRRL